MEKRLDRKIVVPDFYEGGDHVYEDDLGWPEYDRKEARSNVSKEIFNVQVLRRNFNVTFYYVDNDTFYAIIPMDDYVAIVLSPRNRKEKYLGYQCEICHFPDEGEMVTKVPRDERVWENLFIDGKPIEEVLERSYFIDVN